MIGQSTERAPHARVVLPHFAFSALSFLVLAILMLLADTELLSHYFQGKTLAITHLATLGWISMVIFGALYQLIPVVFETRLYSEKLALLTFVLFAVGIVAMVFSFWNQAFSTHLLHASALLLAAFVLFSANVWFTALKSKKPGIERTLILTSVFWFLLTGIVGFLLSANFSHPFLRFSHLELMKVHAHLGLIGWTLMLIMGVGSVLIPMFFLSHQLNKRKLKLAYVATNLGLLLYAAHLIPHLALLSTIGFMVVGVGLAGFLSFVYEAYKKRARKKLDVGLKHTVVSMLLSVLPILLAVLILPSLKLQSQMLFRVSVLYGVSIIIGFVSSLILGQFYKTLPFIIWLWRYQGYVGKFRTPLPKDLYSEKLLKLQYFLYNLSIVLLVLGYISGWEWIVRGGTLALLATALVFNANVFKMFFHKLHLTEF